MRDAKEDNRMMKEFREEHGGNAPWGGSGLDSDGDKDGVY